MHLWSELTSRRWRKVNFARQFVNGVYLSITPLWCDYEWFRQGMDLLGYFCLFRMLYGMPPQSTLGQSRGGLLWCTR